MNERAVILTHLMALEADLRHFLQTTHGLIPLGRDPFQLVGNKLSACLANLTSYTISDLAQAIRGLDEFERSNPAVLPDIQGSRVVQ